MFLKQSKSQSRCVMIFKVLISAGRSKYVEQIFKNNSLRIRIKTGQNTTKPY